MLRQLSKFIKRKHSLPPSQDVAKKRARWEDDLVAPPSESVPTPFLEGTSNAISVHGGTFILADQGASIVNHHHHMISALQVDVLEILRSLALPNFRDIQLDTLAKATEGTFIWFTRGEMFLFWIKKGKVLWGIGIPGAGKTVLVSIVIHSLEQYERASGGTICVAYVYLRYSEPLSVRDVLESLVKHIVEKHPDLIPIVEGLYAKYRQEQAKPSQQDLMEVLARFIECGKTLFFLLDALDEMRSEDRATLVTLLVSLDARLFITSRPLESLQRQFPDAQFFNIAATPSDLDLHIKDFLRRSPDVLELLEGTDLEGRIVETIHQKSGGMFLHVKLQLEALRQCVSALDVEEMLEGFPADIETMYMKTWERILAQGPRQSSLAKVVLLWITHAHGEMTIDTLRRAVATSPATHVFDRKRMVPEALILSVGIPDYTTQEAILPRIIELYPIPHTIPALVCIAYLTSCGFQKYSREAGTGEDDHDFDTLLSNDTLVAYSHRSWAYHARQCRHYTPVMVAVTEFIRNSTVFPLENSDSWVDFGGPLHIAAFYGLEDLISPASQLQPPNATTAIHRRSPLMLAVHGGHLACAKALLSLPDIDINLGDVIGWNALMHAIYNGHIECIRLLVEVPGIDINAAGQEGWTPLICAVRKGNAEAVNVLLGLPGIDINARDENGWTPLICAVRWGHLEVAKLLPRTVGIDINATDRDGWTALMHAADLGRAEIVKHALDAPGVDVNAVSTLRKEKHAANRRVYFNKQDSKNKHNDKWTALMLAARQGRTEAVKQLLAAPGIDVNVMSKPGGETALSQAYRWGHREIVDLLLAFPGTVIPASLDV
ncbi:ankyrin repeat-containing domain protein [Coprinopsis sp. MPI-PUGE-AT-0042]|nr:ankyrin repeat-containing domain protein [Coprinopsis sp. MPI-PUGE-AT-0042]